MILLVLVMVLVARGSATAQEFTYRGFSELRSIAYPQTTPGHDDRLAVDARIRVEPAYKPVSWATFSTSLEARVDNIHQVDREARLDWSDRGTRRPLVTIRQASATVRKGPLVADIGKQFVRWGKTDILAPTDRFAPRDFLEVTADEFLAVTGARLQYAPGAHSFDLVWVPVFTPSRIPLVGKRWAAPTPQTFAALTVRDRGPVFPRRDQFGARWTMLGSGYELSISYFDGFNHLPHFITQLPAAPPSVAVIPASYGATSQQFVALQRTYAPMRMAGADGVVPLRWFALKGEAAWMATSSTTADDVLQYVIQVERQAGELSLVGGYAGEVVTARRSTFDFAPDRGLSRAFLGRAGYTIDATRDVAFEAALRQNLNGVWVKGQYSQAVGEHWRWTIAGAAIGGDESDFIGQYRLNSHVLATLRYSF